MERRQALAVLAHCPLAFGPNDLRRCVWCGRMLLPSQTIWCSPACKAEARRQHVWAAARQAALSAAHGRCHCGRLAVSVHHDPPVFPGEYGAGCQHHADRIRPLCAEHHREQDQAIRAGKPVQLTLLVLAA